MSGRFRKCLVMGPGLSGTHFLRDKLKALNLVAIHEETSMFRFRFSEEDHPERFKDHKLSVDLYQKLTAKDMDWVGAGDWMARDGDRALVGFPYAIMVHYLRFRVPYLPLICVHRKKDEWIKSVTKKGWPLKAFCNLPEGLKSHEDYWQFHEHLMLSATEPVLRLSMGDLDSCQDRIREFLDENKVN